MQLVARLAGLLDLEWTEDSELLAPRLLLLEVGQDVVLTDSELAAYERTADRLNQMWSGSAITRWLYSG